MTQTPVTWRPETNVGAALKMPWLYNFGMLPVVDPNNSLTDIVTDRYIFIALQIGSRPVES